MPKGKVCRITGLSNSGKATIMTALYYEPKKTSDNVVILDGVYYFKVWFVKQIFYNAKGDLRKQILKANSERYILTIKKRGDIMTL